MRDGGRFCAMNATPGARIVCAPGPACLAQRAIMAGLTPSQASDRIVKANGVMLRVRLPYNPA